MTANSSGTVLDQPAGTVSVDLRKGSLGDSFQADAQNPAHYGIQGMSLMRRLGDTSNKESSTDALKKEKIIAVGLRQKFNQRATMVSE